MAEAKRPRCEVCKSSYDVHCTSRPGQIPGAHGALRWICGSCEYAEEHVNAGRVETFRKPNVPQSETLFASTVGRARENGEAA